MAGCSCHSSKGVFEKRLRKSVPDVPLLEIVQSQLSKESCVTVPEGKVPNLASTHDVGGGIDGKTIRHPLHSGM